MDNEMPRLDKTRLTISSLDEFTEEKNYWMSRGKAERLNAIEIHRRMVYGTDRTASRLQRFLETIDGVPVNFISVDDLKTNKQACGRFKDMEDLKHLP